LAPEKIFLLVERTSATLGNGQKEEGGSKGVVEIGEKDQTTGGGRRE